MCVVIRRYTSVSLVLSKMSQRVTKCTVCGQAGHTRMHCSCSGDSRECDCQQAPAKRQKKEREPQNNQTNQKLSRTIKPFVGSSHKKTNNSAKPTQLSRPSTMNLKKAAKTRESSLIRPSKTPTRWQTWFGRVRSVLPSTKKKLRKRKSELGPSNSSSEQCRSPRYHQPQTKRLLRRLTVTTWTKFIGAMQLCCQPFRRREENPKLAVRTIEQECRKQLGGLLPVVKDFASRRSYCRWHWMMPYIRRGLRHKKKPLL